MIRESNLLEECPLTFVFSSFKVFSKCCGPKDKVDEKSQDNEQPLLQSQKAQSASRKK